MEHLGLFSSTQDYDQLYCRLAVTLIRHNNLTFRHVVYIFAECLKIPTL